MTTPYRIIASTILLALGACGDGSSSDPGSANVVNVYNWADYIAPETIRRFETETGLRVNYDTYDAAATVDVKLLTGRSGYDVVVHSNQSSTRLARIGVYQKLDIALLPNISNLDAELTNRLDVYNEIRGYSVPYHWGSTGLMWNVEMIRERIPGQSMDTAAVLFDPDILSKLADCGVSFLDGTTSLIPLALAYLDLDPNAVDEESLQQARELLLKVRPYVRYFSNDKYLSDIPNKELCLAMSWSGDYVTASRRAAEAGIEIEVQYAVPLQGGALWIDGIYIPSDAPHVANAHKFINFLMRADIAADNAEFLGYANANAASWALLSEESLGNPAIYPDEEIWKRMITINTADPVEERRRTRTLARVKSGL